ncbi:MAG: hypothetical protein RLZZ444_1094 [Pseudomonadota bacterium]|jgi:hypothetical protein
MLAAVHRVAREYAALHGRAVMVQEVAVFATSAIALWCAACVFVMLEPLG